jgi:hypothetical protein
MIRDPDPAENLGYPYYGTVDATPHFISSAVRAIQAVRLSKQRSAPPSTKPSRGCSGGSLPTSSAS